MSKIKNGSNPSAKIFVLIDDNFASDNILVVGHNNGDLRYFEVRKDGDIFSSVIFGVSTSGDETRTVKAIYDTALRRYTVTAESFLDPNGEQYNTNLRYVAHNALPLKTLIYYIPVGIFRKLDTETAFSVGPWFETKGPCGKADIVKKYQTVRINDNTNGSKVVMLKGDGRIYGYSPDETKIKILGYIGISNILIGDISFIEGFSSVKDMRENELYILPDTTEAGKSFLSSASNAFAKVGQITFTSGEITIQENNDGDNKEQEQG
jgi:hypothetical protein